MLVIESFEIFNVAEFLEKFQNMSYRCQCSFFSVLCFFNDQVYFYITHLELLREDHARLYSLTMLRFRTVKSEIFESSSVFRD